MEPEDRVRNDARLFSRAESLMTPAEIGRRASPIFRKYGVARAILFGSRARGEATRRSDVDLLAIQESEKRFLDRYDGLLQELVSALAPAGVDLLIYTSSELERIKERPLVGQALREGRVIYESSEGSP
jgi:uncharacterized protein